MSSHSRFILLDAYRDEGRSPSIRINCQDQGGIEHLIGFVHKLSREPITFCGDGILLTRSIRALELAIRGDTDQCTPVSEERYLWSNSEQGWRETLSMLAQLLRPGSAHHYFAEESEWGVIVAVGELVPDDIWTSARPS